MLCVCASSSPLAQPTLIWASSLRSGANTRADDFATRASERASDNNDCPRLMHILFVRPTRGVWPIGCNARVCIVSRGQLGRRQRTSAARRRRRLQCQPFLRLTLRHYHVLALREPHVCALCCRLMCARALSLSLPLAGQASERRPISRPTRWPASVYLWSEIPSGADNAPAQLLLGPRGRTPICCCCSAAAAAHLAEGWILFAAQEDSARLASEKYRRRRPRDGLRLASGSLAHINISLSLGR